MIHATRGMKLGNNWTEKSKSKRATCYIIQCIGNVQLGKCIEIESRLVVVRGEGEGERERGNDC